MSTMEQKESRTATDADILLSVEGVKVHFPIKRGVIFDKTICRSTPSTA